MTQQPNGAYQTPQPQSPQYTAPTAPLPDYVEPQQAPAYAAPSATLAAPTTLAYTNTFALVSVVLAFIVPIAGIVFGHLALGQIKRNGDTGRGLALTGLIAGYAYVVFLALFFIFYFSLIFMMIAGMGAAFGEFGSYDYGYDYS